MLVEINGGYDEGYRSVQGFWGRSPGSLVASFLSNHDVNGSKVLDVGAGEGKNAAAFAAAGASVDAVECSRSAIKNGEHLFPSERIKWFNVDALDMLYPPEAYDVVVSYGLTHCLLSETAARRLVTQLQRTLRVGGVFILVSFNSGSQDLSAAHPGFHPLLLDHDWFAMVFDGWSLIHMSDSILFETHPHNGIPHHHSLTRMTAIKP